MAAATGPSLGGLLIEWADWRLVFFVNLVLGAVAWVPARRLLRETRDPDRGAVPDALGIALLAGGVGLVSLAIVEAPDWGWGSTSVLLPSRSAALARWAFVWRSACTRTRCWSCRCFACARSRWRARACSCSRSASMRVLLANILFLTSVWGYSMLEAGFAVTPGPLMAALSSALAGRIIDRYGSRAAAVPGGLLFALGCVAVRDRAGTVARVPVGVPPGHAADRHGRRAVLRRVQLRGCRRAAAGAVRDGLAISACFRQLGAVLGISVLIAVLGVPDFTSLAYALMAATGAGAGLIALGASRYRPGMDLEERTLDDTIARTCAVCGAELTTQEIKDGREAGGPFLCTVHAMEEAPADEMADSAEPD